MLRVLPCCLVAVVFEWLFGDEGRTSGIDTGRLKIAFWVRLCGLGVEGTTVLFEVVVEIEDEEETLLLLL